MAFNAGTIVVQLQLAASQFQSALAAANAQLQQFQNDTANAGHQMAGDFKDIGRIVSGILVSQAFYNTLNSIEQATGAVWEFSNTLENSQIAWTHFLGSAEQAQGFIAQLEDFAATTPFSFEDVDQGAKRLAAFGFQAESLIPIMRTVGDAAAFMGGGADAIHSINRAIGQIKTKGRVNQEELNQLTEVGIPAVEILTEKLGLTGKELKNIGKAGISASKALPALLEGMDQRYGGMMEAMSNTTEGMLNTIKDNLKFMSVQVLEPAIGAIKAVIRKVRDLVTVWKEASDKLGNGGLFEAIVPDNLEQPIREFIGWIQFIFVTVVKTFKAMRPLVEAWGGAFVGTLQVLLPMLAMLSQVLLNVMRWATQSPLIIFLAKAFGALFVVNRVAVGVMTLALAIRTLFVITGGWSVIKMLVSALMGLFTILPPIIGFLATIPGLITAIAAAALIMIGIFTGAFDGMINSVKGFYNELVGWGEDMFKNILQPDIKIDPPGVDEDTKKGWEDYFKDTGESIDDTGKKAKKTKKEIDKFIASFDEVFQVPEKNKDISDSIDDVKVPDVKTPKIDTGKIKDEMKKIKWPKWPKLPKFPEIDFSRFKKTFDDWWFFIKRHYDDPDDPTNPKNWKNRWNEWIHAVENALQQFQGQILRPFSLELPSLQPVRDFLKQLGSLPAPSFPPIGIPGLNLDGLQNLYNGLKEWFGNLGSLPVPSFPPIGLPKVDLAELEKLVNGIKEWYGNLGSIPSISLAPIYSPAIIGNGGALYSTVKGWYDSLSSITSPTLPPVTVPVVIGEPALVSVQNLLSNIGTTITTFFTVTLPNFFVIGMTSLATSFTGAFQTFGNTVMKLWEEHKVAILITVGIIASLILAVMTFGLSAVVEAVIGFVVAVGGWLGRLAPLVTTAITKIPGIFSTIFSRIPGIFTGMVSKISGWLAPIGGFFATALKGVSGFFTTAFSKIPGIFTGMVSKISGWLAPIGGFFSNALKGVSGFFTTAFSKIPGIVTTLVSSIGKLFGKLPGAVGKALNALPNAVGKIFGLMWTKISSFFGKLGNISIPGVGSLLSAVGVTGFAQGGIVGTDSIVRVGEGGRREAIIPLQNQSAMAPFADAVAKQVASMVSNQNSVQPVNNDQQQIIQVGTLIADERSLKELERRMRVVRNGETARGVRS